MSASRVLALSVAVLAGGCSAIVASDPSDPIQCRVSEGVDPCRPLGLVCSEMEGVGVCRLNCAIEQCANGLDDDCDGAIDEVAERAEICNGEDDDCDEIVDEGLDEDGDGASWCESAAGEQDCNDALAAVRPSDDPSVEICDGLDNDCNPATDDGVAECGEDQACNRMTGACETVYCDVRASLCTADEFCLRTSTPPECRPRDSSCFAIECSGAPGIRCNPARGECVMPQPDGTECEHDSECASNLCVPGTALRLSDLVTGVCSKTCCSDTDCGSGSRCWASGNGARACVAEPVLAMGEFGAPTSQQCATRDDCSADCIYRREDVATVRARASTVCGDPYVARSSCVTSFDCGFFEFCVDRTCSLDRCESIDDCASGLCAGRCIDPCGSADDCGIGNGLEGTDAPACTYFEARTEGRTDHVAACNYLTDAEATQGTPCTSDAGCRDAACVDANGNPFGEGPRTCADTCCNDDDCANGQCRPVFIHGHWETHCLREPSFPALGERPD